MYNDEYLDESCKSGPASNFEADEMTKNGKNNVVNINTSTLIRRYADPQLITILARISVIECADHHALNTKDAFNRTETTGSERKPIIQFIQARHKGIGYWQHTFASKTYKLN